MRLFVSVFMFLGMLNPIHAMEGETPLERLFSLREDVNSIRESVLLAKRPFSEPIIERVRKLILDEDLRQKYAIAKYTNQRLKDLIDKGIPISQKFNVYPCNASNLAELSKTFSMNVTPLLKETEPFIDTYETLVGEISKIKEDVLGNWLGERFAENMLQGMKF